MRVNDFDTLMRAYWLCYQPRTTPATESTRNGSALGTYRS